MMSNEQIKELIQKMKNFKQIDPAIIEKDYYVTIFLKELSTLMPNILFKGGTCLSKCYHVIDRFSEDIDLTLQVDAFGRQNQRHLCHAIFNVCQQLNFKIIHPEHIQSHKKFNRYHIDYNHQFESAGVVTRIQLETSFYSKIYPSCQKKLSSIFYDFLYQINR